LTTDVTGSGGLGGAGAAAVHEGVKRLITEQDIKAEAQTLRQQLFAPMLRFRFPTRFWKMPLPQWVRRFRDATTADVKAGMIRTASQEIGLPVPQRWAMESLGIPEAEDDEALIKRIEPVAPAAPFSE
jgi:phage gp29-like protein